MLVSTCVLTPSTWLKLSEISPKRTFRNDLKTFNFETVEMCDNGHKIVTLCNGTVHSKIDYKGESWPSYMLDDGTRAWHVNRRLHRDNDKPAFVWGGGSQSWYMNGRLHRDNDKPAWVAVDGCLEWWVNGKRHRDPIEGIDQPARVGDNGSQWWHVNGKCHRDPVDGVGKPVLMHTYGYLE